MKSRHLGAFCACVISLTISSSAIAAYYDFDQWVNDNAEQGFDNSNPFKLTVDGLELTAKAINNVSNSSPHVYLDDIFDGQGGVTAGVMGVCPELDTNNHCIGNPTIERNEREKLRWDFSENISSMTLEFVNTTNGFASQKFQYKYNGDSWVTATTDTLSMATLVFDGSSSRIQFRAKSNNVSNEFYIVSADVSAVPVPAAAWLFVSGLLGLVAVSRRHNNY